MQSRADLLEFVRTVPDSKIEGILAALSAYEGGEQSSKISVVAKTRTVLKALPLDSSRLRDRDDYFWVQPGDEYEIQSVSREGSHYVFSPAIDGKFRYAFKEHWIVPEAAKLAARTDAHELVTQAVRDRVTELQVSQPDARTCQSAAIGMGIGSTDVYGIRRRLDAMGVAGDPYVMGRLLTEELGERYEFHEFADLADIRTWLKDGEFLIIHGWFTGSGHVIALDGLSIDADTMSHRYDVSDPWSEFEASTWSYPHASTFYDGYYSERCIYAACVAGQSVSDAARIYGSSEPVNEYFGNAWVHRIKPFLDPD